MGTGLPSGLGTSKGTSPEHPDEPNLEPQILLILVGLPGSGKSTFAESLVRISNNPSWIGGRRWIRASQDDAPNRRRQECEAMTRNGLRMGCHTVVDRVGFDRAQRAHFIAIADTITPRPRVHCLIFVASLATLERRLRLRPSHPTLPDPDRAISVLVQMRRQIVPPRPEDGEGFDLIFSLAEDKQPAGGLWGMQEVRDVLERIEREGVTEAGPRHSVPIRDGYGGRGRGFSGGNRGEYRPPSYDPGCGRYPQPGPYQQYPAYRPYPQAYAYQQYPSPPSAQRPAYRPPYQVRQLGKAEHFLEQPPNDLTAYDANRPPTSHHQ